MGDIYAAPYLVFEPRLAFVVEKGTQVAGFCVGTADTKSFATQLEADWWPDLRKKYVKPKECARSTWSADERRSAMIHWPETPPSLIVANYPAHLHMNLLPEVQGQGVGRRLHETWMNSVIQFGVNAVHIGANAKNARAIRFWRHHGFKRIPARASRTTWMGRKIN